MNTFFLMLILFVIFFYVSAIYHRAIKITDEQIKLGKQMKELEASHQILKDAIGCMRGTVKNLHN